MREAIIVTYYSGLNYGSMLQAAAMRVTLRKLDVDSCFLEKFRVIPFTLAHPSLLAARAYRKLTASNRKRFFMPSDYVRTENKQNRLATFAAEETPVVSFMNLRSWREAMRSRTVFIAGSDITWNPANGIPGKFFLDFAVAAGLPCFSYAASIGAKQLPQKWSRWYRQLFAGYLAIGVRESSSIKLLEPYYDGPIEQVLDPTLLLTADEWDAFADKAKLSVDAEPEGYVLCYFVMDDSRYWDYVQLVQEDLRLPVIVLPMHESDGVAQEWNRVEDATPYEFVWLVKNAAVVVTDSFHACSFCLTYKREFYLLRRERNAEDSKYDDFLGRFGLEDRSVKNEGRYERIPSIYTNEINELLAGDRERSVSFLRKTLDKAFI